ncbi:SDR family oxidoreductase [Candidatus Saccharibacteria bacterium]|nr:SDR family oxidoreductase [Candidatus Saccharibacteria bacterium]
MKILVLGANGRVGSKVVASLLGRGHSVVAAVHKSHANVPEAAEVFQINLEDRESIEKAIIGCDAVVCALSSWNAPKHDVLATAMKIIIPIMEASGVKRIVSISGDVARVEGENISLPIRLFHIFAFGPIRQVITDSEEHISLLGKSKLDWTVLRPGIMTSAEHGNYTLRSSHPFSITIPRAAVVESIVDLVESDSYVRAAPFIARS